MVKAILQQRPAVGKPQAKFLETLFATILARRGRVNFRPLRRDCDDGERTIARQFRRCFAWPDFQPRVIMGALDPCAEVIAAQEASFLPTSGPQTCGRGHVFSGCTSRADRGLASSTLAVVDVTRRCAFTLALAQPPSGHDETGSQPAQEETRGDVYRQQRREPRHRLPPQVTYPGVAGDLATKTSLAEAVRLDLPLRTKRRCDAAWRFRATGPPPKRRGARRQSDGKGEGQDLRRVESLGTMAAAEQLHLSTAVVWHITLNGQLRLVVVVHRQAPAKPRDRVLASTAPALAGRQLVAWDGARVPSEFLCRDSTPFTGLSDGPARAEAVRDFPVNAARATLNLARPEPRLAQTGESPPVCSLASGKPRQCHERWLDGCIEQ